MLAHNDKLEVMETEFRSRISQRTSNAENKQRKKYKPLVLLLVDGVGAAPMGMGNAVLQAKTPNLDRIWPQNPHGLLSTSGLDVGLPRGEEGNAEAGHLALGVGKVIYNNLARIDYQLEADKFKHNGEILRIFDYIKSSQKKLNLWGVISSSEEIASLDHVLSLIKLAVAEKLPSNSIQLHAVLDGVDSPPKQAAEVLTQIDIILEKTGIGQITTLIGRKYACDNSQNWKRTRKAWDLYFNGDGRKFQTWKSALKELYLRAQTDFDIDPVIIRNDRESFEKVQQGDAFISFNLSEKFSSQFFEPFFSHIDNHNEEGQQSEKDKNKSNWMIPKTSLPEDLQLLSFVEYRIESGLRIAFPSDKTVDTLGKAIADAEYPQLRIAESERFPHVTFYLNGGSPKIYPGEDRIEVPSPSNISDYATQPEMSTHLVGDLAVTKIKEAAHKFIVITLANVDLVGLTGQVQPTIRAMEIADEVVGRVQEAVDEVEGTLIITSTHGNSEELIDIRTKEFDYSNSLNPVPIIISHPDLDPRELQKGTLPDLTITILKILGIEVPYKMRGRDLLRE